MIHWSEQFIGIPFKSHGRDREGIDCWGLARLVMLERFGIELPSYLDEYENANDREDIGPAILDHQHDDDWLDIPPGEAREGDMALLRIGRFPVHVGVMINREQFLHAWQGANSCIERLGSAAWKNRIVGIYRHARLA